MIEIQPRSILDFSIGILEKNQFFHNDFFDFTYFAN